MRIELSHVSKSFGAQRALDDVTLTIASGAQIALIGPNGSGKSTLLRVLMGLVAAEGSVRLDGRSPFHERSAIAERLAYVPQVAPQLGATVAEIVGAVTMLRSIGSEGVRSRAAALGVDWASVAQKPFRALSGGTKQKMLLALAFAAEPALLILDEPTASLDTAARDRFNAMLLALPATTTVILCTHRAEDLHRLSGGVVELAEGRVVRALSVAHGEARSPVAQGRRTS